MLFYVIYNMLFSLLDSHVFHITTMSQGVLFKPRFIKVSLREISFLLGNISWAIHTITFTQMH